MKRYGKLMAFAVVLVVLAGGLYALRSRLGGTSSAGGMPQGGTPPGAPMGGPPGGADFEKSHKYAMQLMRLLNDIGRLDDEGKLPLTGQQAKAALAILKPLRERDSLEETACRQALKDLRAVLTDDQRTAIGALPPEPRFRQGGPPPGGAPPPGGPPDSGRTRQFNPLNPPEGGPSDRERPDGSGRLFDDLEKKSTGSGG